MKQGKFHRFTRYFRPHWKLFAFDLFCAVISSLILVAFPISIHYALNTYLPAGAYQSFFLLMVGIIVAYLFNALLNFLISYYGHMLGVQVEADMRSDLFAHLQKLSFHFYDHNRTGELMSRVTTDLFEITEFAHHGLEDAVIFGITFIGAFAAMFTMNWRLSLVTFFIIPIGLIYIYASRKKTMSCSREMKRKLGNINADLETSLSGIRVTKAFANETYEQKRFDQSNNRLKTAKDGFFKQFSIFHASIDLIKNLLKISVILVGGLLYIQGRSTLAEIITFNLFITVLMQPIQKLIGFSETFMAGLAGIERFDALMRTQPEVHDAQNAVILSHVKGEIVFKDVSFQYDNEDVLHQINLHIDPGKTLALVGPSGAGKTTLCQLIPRFYDTTQGSILIDGQNIQQVTLNSLRKNIGIVQQDVFIFTDTIMENIRYGSEHKTDEEIIAAAKMAEIHQDILRMEDGYQTFVGEKGAMLSGGQKQRISLARMFLKNPPIIIFDEATSALDSITEFKIQGAINKLADGRTMIIIAHRLSTIRHADMIAVVDSGRIVEMGSHQELMALGGEYSRMYQAQYGQKEA